MAAKIVTRERLRELFDYEPETGIFRVRKVRVGSKKRPGDVWGTVSPKGRLNYIIGMIDGKFYPLHRLAWLYVYGNHHVLNAKNTSGYRGVSWRNDRRKWKAYINRNDRQFHLGYFHTKEAAYEAYKAAAVAHFGEFANV